MCGILFICYSRITSKVVLHDCVTRSVMAGWFPEQWRGCGIDCSCSGGKVTWKLQPPLNEDDLECSCWLHRVFVPYKRVVRGLLTFGHPVHVLRGYLRLVVFTFGPVFVQVPSLCPSPKPGLRSLRCFVGVFLCNTGKSPIDSISFKKKKKKFSMSWLTIPNQSRMLSELISISYFIVKVIREDSSSMTR